jgi:hypothetical protein
MTLSPDTSPHCIGRTKVGKPCSSPPTANREYCAHHDPSIPAEEKSAWGRRGALATRRKGSTAALATATSKAVEVLGKLPDAATFTDADSITRYLEQVADALRDRALPPSSAKVMVELALAAQKMIDTAQVARLTTIAEQRAAALNAQGFRR